MKLLPLTKTETYMLKILLLSKYDIEKYINDLNTAPADRTGYSCSNLLKNSEVA
jgi:hypothetical protein